MRGFLRRPWGPGWALVGDASYFKDPITAHGISAARTAVVDGDMDDYHRTRDRLSLPLFRVTDTIASYRWDSAEIEGLLRSLAAAMADEVTHLSTLDEAERARLAG